MKPITASCYAIAEPSRLVLGNRLFSHTVEGRFTVQAAQENLEGLSEPFLSVVARAVDQQDERCFRIWPGLPVVEELSVNAVHSFPLRGEHWLIRAIRLYTLTDETDTFFTEQTCHLFNGKAPMLQGHLFFLENQQDGSAVMLMAKAPDFYLPTLRVERGQAVLDAGGCGVVIGFCGIGACERLCRDYLRHLHKPSGLYSMSNTWGDRNGWSRVNQDFIRREIDAAHALGVDIVQIDDGWQTGSTADLSLRDESGRRMFIGDFWSLHTGRFPDGIAPLTAYAAEKGIRMGLWFAPDSRNEFALLERDLSVLRHAYLEWGIRYFKLDMIHIESERGVGRMLELLRGIYAFGPDVSVQLDVTNGKRLGYLCGAEYGSIFAENRYTASGNAFPHRVLRNLWMLSRVLPASRLQFELVNPDLNRECYAPDDPFAPVHYDMDYLFAAVMLSNPLFWMEMQFLSKPRRDELARLMPVWRQHRDTLGRADVSPIGEKPSGRSFSGFYVQSGETVYLLLFRENTEEREYCFALPQHGLQSPALLASNTDVRITLSDAGVRVSFGKPRGYALLIARCPCC